MNAARRIRLVCGSLAVAIAATGALGSNRAWAEERGPAVHAAAGPGEQARVIVKFRPGAAPMRAQSAGAGAVNAGPKSAQSMSARLGLALTDGLALGERTQVLKATGVTSDELARQLSAQSDVEYAVVDARRRVRSAPNDPLFASVATQDPPAGQWYLQPPGTVLPLSGTTNPLVSAINAQAAWAVTTGKPAIVIADLDTGIRPEHPDFAGKLLPGYDMISDVPTGNNGLGRNPDPSDPGDWITAAEDNQVGGQFYHCGLQDSSGAYVGESSSWHGTQTAGLLAAATNNGAGMASIGYNAKLLPVRVLGKCGGYDSDIIAGMLWAAGISVPGVPDNPNPANVVNMSLGGTGTCSSGGGSYGDAVAQLAARKVVVVVASGNEGLAVDEPANCPGVIAVGGVRHTGTKVGYSNLGPEVTISAPAGNCVNTSGACLYPLLSTGNTGATSPNTSAQGQIYTGSGANASLGTSFSTPLVAGTVALMLSANPTLTPAQVKAALQTSARPFPTSTGVVACTAPSATAQNECSCPTPATPSTPALCGAGLLDAGAAVKAVAVVSANIGVASANAVVGTAVTLDGSGSTPANAVTYAWSISTNPANIATITSASNAATLTVLPSGTGTVTVDLTVTDPTLGGAPSSTSTVLTVAAASTTPPTSNPPAPTSSGGGGGGAMGVGWLIGWLASVIGVWAVTPRRPRRSRPAASPPPGDAAD